MNKSNVLYAGLAAIAVLGCVVQASAVQPSPEKMTRMGLSDAHVVSDRVALAVRGFGYRGGGTQTRIWGTAVVEVNGVKRRDNYRSAAPRSQFDSTFVAAPVGGTVFFAGGGSGVWVP